MRKYVFPIIAIIVVAAALVRGSQHYSFLRLVTVLYLFVCVGAAFLAMVAGPSKKPFQQFAKRFDSFIHLDGKIEIATFIVFLSFPVFQLALIGIAWASNWSTWLAKPDLESIMSFWAITAAAALGTSAAEYKKGALTENLPAGDALALANRLEIMLIAASRKAKVTTFYLAIGVLTQVLYWLATVHLSS